MKEKLKTLVVDDDLLTREVINNFVDKTDFLTLSDSCSSGIEAANILNNSKIDLVFLDVEMPDMSGIELINTIKDLPEVVLVTSKEKYAVEAFELEALDYIVKPIRYSRFLKAAKKAYELIQNKAQIDNKSNKLFFKFNGQYIGIDYNDILYIESLGDYVKIYANEKKYTIHSTLKGMLLKLPTKDFQRVHRSYIIRLDQVNSIEENTVFLSDKYIPIGKTYKDQLMSRLNMV